MHRMIGSLRAGFVSGAMAMLAAVAAPQARAQTTMTRFTVFMHSGPGMQFSVTDEIPTQTPLAPEICAGGWCRIRYGNALGWVDQSMLASSPPTAQPRPGERPVDCVDFARTGWPHEGDLDRACIYPINKTPEPGG